MQTIRRVRSFLLLFALVLIASQAFATTKSLVIARLYGGGGSAATSPIYDYVELFNGGTTAVNLKYFTLQYQGGTSTTTFGSSALVTLPDYSLAPGQYYLIQFVPQTAPTMGTPLTLTADYTWTWANTTDYSTSNGKLALVLGNALLPACAVSGVVTSPPPASQNLVDFFSYGNGTNGSTIVSNCAEGSAPSGNGSGTRAQYRIDVCNDTDNNNNDFTTVSGSSSDYSKVEPAHNSATKLAPCTTSTGVAPSNTPGNRPTVAIAGAALTVTATAAAGSSPASTSLRAFADLTAFGGSATQQLYDDATNGDAAAGDNIFSYTFTVPAGQAAGSTMVPVSVYDEYYRFNTKNLVVGVGGALPPTLPIHAVQSAVPSTYAGQMVTVEGIVTAIVPTGFYLQTPDAGIDSDPKTSEAIFVAASTEPTGLATGMDLIVTGTVISNTYANTLGGALSTVQVTTGNALPAAIALTSADQNTNAAPLNLQRVEGMRVTIAGLTTVSGTGGTIGSDGTATTDGNFYAVFAGTPRPLREAGVPLTDTLPAGSPSGVVRFDGNPERLEVNTLNIYGKTIDLTASASLTGAAGVFEFASGTATLQLSSYPTTITGQLGFPAAAPAPGDTKFAVASVNLDDLYNATKDGSEPEVLSAANYTGRLYKASTLIRTLLATPDVVAVQNVENLATLQDLAARISTDAISAGVADPAYVPYLETGSDPTLLNTGFLVRTLRASVTGETQMGQAQQYTNPAALAQALTFTHPPVVLQLAVNQSGGTTYPLTVINTLLTPYTGSAGEAGTAGANVRAQREAQAEYIANLVQSHQAAGEGVVVTGGFNSLQVSDGYVDVIGEIKGTPAASTTVVQASPSVVATPLTDLGATAAAASRYSHVLQGNAEAVDTILISTSLASGSSAVYMHNNADYQETVRNTATSLLRGGSHDAVLADIAVPKLATASAATISKTAIAFGDQPVSAATTQTVTLSNAGTSALTITSVAVSGAGFTQSSTCGATLAVNKTCVITVSFTPTAVTSYTGTLSITDSAPTSPQTVALTGNGVVSSATATPTTLTFASTVAGTSSDPQTVTVTNTGTSTMSISSATFTNFPGTVTNNCTAITAGNTCTVLVMYSPTVAGTQTGTLSLGGNIAAPLIINVSGSSVAANPQAVLNPNVVDFGNQTLSIASTAIVVTLSNPGTGSLSNITTAVSGDFARTTTCTATLAQNATCTITITFTPTALGARTGSLTLTDNATGSPQSVSLSGTGVALAPILTLTPASLNFSNTIVNTTSSSQTVTVKNVGYAALTFTNIAASANFTLTGGTCSTATSIAVNGTCTLTVASSPKAGGATTGTITLTDNATVPTQTVALTGAGLDFTLTPDAAGTSLTVKGGETASFHITFSSQPFTGTITLACGGTLPQYSSCIVPASIALISGTSQTITVSVPTFSQTLARNNPASPSNHGGGVAMALGLAGLLFVGVRRRKTRAIRLLALCLFAVAMQFGLTGCSVTAKPATQTNVYATPPGTYTLTLTATSGAIVHTLPLTVTVQ